MKRCFYILALVVLSQACENLRVDSETATTEEDIEEEFEEATEESEAFEGVEDATQTLPATNEEDEGNGGIISGGVKPDDGNQLCRWLKPKASDKKSVSLYGCQTSPKISATKLTSANLRDSNGQKMTIIERRTNHRGYAVVFVIAPAHQHQPTSNLELILVP